MKIDHRLLLWCVAAWVCCAVGKCHVEFFDADGKALREKDILDNDWVLKEDEVKTSEESYRTKPYHEHFLFQDIKLTGGGGSRGENEEGGDGDGDGGSGSKVEDPEKKAKCETKCGTDYETKEIKCEINGNDVLCMCPDKENVKYGFDYDNTECKICDCGTNAEDCNFNEGGTIKCSCKTNYKQKDGKCELCDCGTNAEDCNFNEDGTIKCSCKTNYKQKDGKCELCNCGTNSEDCTFDASGKINCSCLPNFAQKGDTCEACECGEKSTGCSFDDKNGQTCTCQKGFAQKGDLCVEEACVEECGKNKDAKCEGTGENIKCECEDEEKKFDREVKECRRPCENAGSCNNGAQCEGSEDLKFCECPPGIEGDTCDIITDCTTGKYVKCKGGVTGECKYDHKGLTAVCICKVGYELKDKSGYCARCDCGDNSADCFFLNDKKTCNCSAGYAEKNGKCQPCNCGNNSVSCSFKGSKITCICKDGFGDNGGKCQKCSCGENVKSCLFENGEEACICKDGFALKNGTCEVCNCGKHSTKCRFENSVKVCDCKDGYEYDDDICRECNCGENSTSCKYENGSKICTCKEDYKQRYGKCKPCVCGENMKECKFEKGDMKCECLDKFSEKNGTCTDCDCGEHSTGCNFEEKGKKCLCKEGYREKDGKCIEDNCLKICGVSSESKDIKCLGDWFGDAINIKCSCINKKLQFDSEKKECRETCDDKKKCQNSAKCVKKGDHSFCDCLKNTAGYHCQILTECEKGNRLEKCKGNKGKCEYNHETEEAYCDCNKEKQFFDQNEGYCRTKCNIIEDCPKGQICFDRLYCTCEEGKAGDNCDIVTGCNDDLKEKCKNASAECTFSKTPPNFATCECKDKNFVFVEEEGKCVAKFCKNIGCKSNATCEFDSGTGTAFCRCPNGTYYNYKTEACSEPDKCLLRKEPCKENYVCEEGECKCYGEEQDGKCIKEAFCKEGACFPGAKCDNDTATCKCDKDHYFTGSSCEEVKCIKDPFHPECPCPSGTDKNSETKKCEVPKDKECNKDCGLGYCSNDTCICIDGISIPDKDKCILDGKKVCASNELNEDLKTCKCTGKYKQADDKITCQLVTCVEEQECNKKSATCKMNWTGDKIGYRCECPDGYVENEDKGICTDPCSVDENMLSCAEKDQVCYNSLPGPDNKLFTCDCAPPFITNTKNCDDVADFTYLISGIPILKKRYQMGKAIDYVKLNNDLTESLSQMYDNNIFNSGYLHDYVEVGDVLNTSVWVRFNQNISGHLRRFSLQAQNFPNITCEECDTDLYMWPPHVVLKGNDFKDVNTKSLSVCAKDLRSTLCGEEADCKENKCFCPRGYKTLGITIKNIGEARILRCEKTTIADVDECALKIDTCPNNTICFKTPGSYICNCKPGYWKSTQNDRKDCVDLCTPSPCGKGSCSLKNDKINCKCEAGYGGSYCDEADVNFAAAKKSTVVVGSVLGTILILCVLGALFFYLKKRKSSYSEDFMPAPRQDLASEMRERRPIRGVVNTSYE